MLPTHALDTCRRSDSTAQHPMAVIVTAVCHSCPPVGTVRATHVCRCIFAGLPIGPASARMRIADVISFTLMGQASTGDVWKARYST